MDKVPHRTHAGYINTHTRLVTPTNNRPNGYFNDIAYVITHIQTDLPDTKRRQRLLTLLNQTRNLLDTTPRRPETKPIESHLNDILRHIIEMKFYECKRGTRGSTNRTSFWTLTMTQALLAVILADFTSKHWLKYKLKYIAESLPDGWLSLYHKHPNSIVYYIFNTDNPMDYIGESNQWKTRFFSEITDAQKLSSMLRYNDHPKYQSKISARKGQYPYAIRVIQRQGVEGWISIPVRNLSGTEHPQTQQTIRKRYEKFLIHSLSPKMNTMGTKRPHVGDKSKRQQRRRPPIAIRKTKKV